MPGLFKRSNGIPITTKPVHLDVNQQIECARILASRFYTDPAILDIEKFLFYFAATVAARADKLPGPAMRLLVA